MIIIVTGATHTGKTLLSQKLMEKHHIPYICQDHIKMGLIRSGFSTLRPDLSDEKLTQVLWPITKEIIKTAIENKQSLIVEGCYVPFNWREDFEETYLKEIDYICLCFSDRYIDENYSMIMQYESCLENRQDSEYCTKELLKKENNRFKNGCDQNNLKYIWIDEDYTNALKLCL